MCLEVGWRLKGKGMRGIDAWQSDGMDEMDGMDESGEWEHRTLKAQSPSLMGKLQRSTFKHQRQ
jgi:hypothetical protein